VSGFFADRTHTQNSQEDFKSLIAKIKINRKLGQKQQPTGLENKRPVIG